MNTKYIVLIILIISFLVLGGSILATKLVTCSSLDGLYIDVNCFKFFKQKIEPLFWSFLPLFAISFILLFFKQEVFVAWARFGLPTFFIMLAVIYYTYNNAPSTGGAWFDWGSDEQFASTLLPIIFFFGSLIVIIRKKISLSRKGS